MYRVQCLVADMDIMEFSKIYPYSRGIVYCKERGKLMYLVFRIDESDTDEVLDLLRGIYKVESLALQVKLAPKLTNS